MTRSHIRNFAIIAHVDHGKSTLADRFLEITGVVPVGGHEEQLLDRNPISRERGITIKLAPVTMKYVVRNNFFIKDQLASRKAEPLGLHSSSHSEESFQSSFAQTTDFSKKIISSHSTEYILNLIDTPGHVDFSYEVDRTLSCVEGVILLVDATQGVQAQTIANAYKAIEKNLIIIPVVNKVDMANAQIQKTKDQLSGFLGIDHNTIFEISAKTGQNVGQLLHAVVEKIPAPKHNYQEPNSNFQATINEPTTNALKIENPLRALIFDSYYDVHKGVIAFIRVFGGTLEKGREVRLVHTDVSFKVLETGIFKPDLVAQDKLLSGDIGM
ncbi:MAG: GTP-binding protein [Patescibacteria group bacterium]